MWYIHTVECYSALKRKTVLTSASTRVNLEDISLSEEPFTKARLRYDSTCISYREQSTSYKDRVGWWVPEAGGVGEGTGSCCFVGTEFEFYEMDRVLEMDGGDGCTTV